ncbi:MAG TPA: Txe/YoeB family addiction module toxin [Chthoniobacteraceae bacterium]|jgi:Txe/YoeB family toxin of toxin-antitoxin system|nr:Txe/YoeB family addiction module toxin [Chthoniobacteraceae bacterium]
MNEWRICYAPHAEEDWQRLKRCGLRNLPTRVKMLVDVLKRDPYQSPPPFKKLDGDLKGMFSRRINQQHRLVYAILHETRTVKVLACWGHYND